MPPVPEPNPKHAIDALAIAQRSLTIRKDEIGIPLDSDVRLAVIDCQRFASSIAEDPVDRKAILKDELKSAFPKSKHVAIGEQPTDRECAAARAVAEKADVVLYVTRDADLIPTHAGFGQELSLSKPLIHASVRAPYDSAVIPAAKANLLTYGDPPVSLQALVDVLSGRAKAEGTAPVKIEAAVEVAV